MTVTERSSIRQVAERAGVSRMTVSRVLSDRSHLVAEATQRRVLQAVRELNYIPVSQPATQGRHVETRTIGLVFDGTDFKGVWGLATFLGLSEAALQLGYDLLTILRHPPGWALEQQELRFLDRRTDGLIFIMPRERDKVFHRLMEHEIPVVSCFIDQTPRGVPSVSIDNAGAMQLAVQHLVSLGHRRILHWTSRDERSDFAERRWGYEQAMRAAQLTPLVLEYEDADTPTHALMATITEHRVTALACANDMLALAAWDAAKENGLEIPRDLSLVGMDDLPQAQARGLDSVCFSCEEVGRRALETLVALTKEEPKRVGWFTENFHPVKNSIVPVELVQRASSARLPA